MICTTVFASSIQEAEAQILACQKETTLLELRLEELPIINKEEIAHLRSLCSVPVIFTLRPSSIRSEEKRLEILKELLFLHPDYLDIEIGTSPLFIEKIREISPTTRLILSYHNFDILPKDIEEIYRNMKKIQATFYKIAVQPLSTTEVLRFMVWVRSVKDFTLIPICMGPLGQISRILSSFLFSPLVYVCPSFATKNSLGQISAHFLKKMYHWNNIHPTTKVYGLIGSTVEQSPSNQTHNAIFSYLQQESVYIKMVLLPSELPAFLSYAKQLPFSGLSVTLPLKEKVVPFLDSIDPKAAAIGAVNTLIFENGKIHGCNTDAEAALDVLEKRKPVKGTRFILLGAGGSALAIAYEASARGADVILLNRTKKRDHVLPIETIQKLSQEGYDFLINTTGTDEVIQSCDLHPQAIVMDIRITPEDLLFLQQAKQAGCKTIHGKEMFFEQAKKQWALWIKPHDEQVFLDPSLLEIFESSFHQYVASQRHEPEGLGLDSPSSLKTNDHTMHGKDAENTPY